MFISKLCRIDKQIYLTSDHSSMGLTNSLQKVCQDHHSCECSWVVYYVLLCAQSCLTLCDSMDFNPQALLSMGFSRQEYWSVLLFPPPGDLPEPRIEPKSPVAPAWQADS